MAQKVTVRLIDDLDGSEAVETVSFGLDGKDYEIDLNAHHAERFRDGLAEFVANSRRVKPQRGGKAASRLHRPTIPRQATTTPTPSPAPAPAPTPTFSGNSRSTVLDRVNANRIEPPPRTTPRIDPDQELGMREWLRRFRPDLKVGEKGRISAAGQEAYNNRERLNA